MKKEVINLDIGAGAGKSFTRRAKENPDQYFVAMEPSTGRDFSPEASSPNIFWVKGRAEPLPIKSGSVDKVNIDFVFVFLYGEDREEGKNNDFHEEASRMIQEGLRAIKPGGSLLIREPRYMLRELAPIMSEMGVNFSSALIPLEEAMEHSVSAREFAEEANFGDKESHPYLIRIPKDGNL